MGPKYVGVRADGATAWATMHACTAMQVLSPNGSGHGHSSKIKATSVQRCVMVILSCCRKQQREEQPQVRQARPQVCSKGIVERGTVDACTSCNFTHLLQSCHQWQTTAHLRWTLERQSVPLQCSVQMAWRLGLCQTLSGCWKGVTVDGPLSGCHAVSLRRLESSVALFGINSKTCLWRNQFSILVTIRECILGSACQRQASAPVEQVHIASQYNVEGG
jgi:hypothetical protein